MVAVTSLDELLAMIGQATQAPSPVPHTHMVNARILRDGGEAVCIECGCWVWVDPETGVAVERSFVDAKE